MAGFGGFAPLPLRLGTNAVRDWSPEQHARLCADLAAVCAVAQLALVTFSANAGVSLVSYRGMPGSGASLAPTLAWLSDGVITAEWAPSYKDAYGVAYGFNINHANAWSYKANGKAVVEILTPQKVKVRVFGGVVAEPVTGLLMVA